MFARDAFTCWLEQNGPPGPAKLYHPGACLGASPVGWELVVGRTRFVYRVPAESPDVFYIVLIARGPARHALHSPFADLVRLLRLVQRSGTGIRWIRGHIEPVKKRPADALARERILAFYARYLTAVSRGFENGIEWFGGDLAAFSWSAEKRRIRDFSRPRPTRTGEFGAKIAAPV